jgi:hypothetical protein
MSSLTLRRRKPWSLHVIGREACPEVLDETLTAPAVSSHRWMRDRDG